MTWKITAFARRAETEAALLAQETASDWDGEIVVAASEVAEDRPEDWRFEAWLPRQPTAADLARVAGLFVGEPPSLTIEQLPETDWVAASQAGLEPIVAGRFRVRTPEHPAADASECCELVIPVAQAFGTGQHATTAGCLEMLTNLADGGVTVTNCADIGTGTGLLAFAALRLWPGARGIASDIDPICAAVIGENAALNGIPLGPADGELAFVVADGLDHPELRARAPYDLLIANILAGPLIELAPAFTAAMDDGHLILAGLLTSQENAVREAYERAGLKLARNLVRGDWSILCLRGGQAHRTRCLTG